jgi:signal peptidase II
MFFLLLIALFFLIDFHLKNLIEISPNEKFPKSLLHGHIELRRLHNKGLAGGRLKKNPRIATLVSGICLLIVSLLMLPVLFKKGRSLAKLAISMILGGAFGNFFDRLGRGYVVDYLSFPKVKIKQIRKYLYNLADLLIFLGSGILLLRELFGKD